MVNLAQEIDAAEAQIRATGKSVRAALQEMDINPSTWTRWKSGDTSPTFRTWGKVQSYLKELEAPNA